MPTIVIWMSPEPGHILPTIKIARDLAGHGHSVLYQVPMLYKRDLECLGFQTLAFFEDIAHTISSSLYHPEHSANWYYRQIRIQHPGDSYRLAFRAELLRAVSSVNADLLVVDGTWHRYLALNMNAYLPPTCRLMKIYPHLPFPGVPAEVSSLEEGAVVYLSPKDFEIPNLVVDGVYYTEGAVFRDSSISGSDIPNLEGSGPLVYCSFGSQHERYEQCLNTLREVLSTAALRAHYRFIVDAGKYAQCISSPRENVFVGSALSLHAILPRASLMIFHGGFGSIKNCIHSEVPMLLIPQKWDQELNSQRIVHHKLGLKLDPNKVSAMSLASAIDALVLDSAYRSRLRAMRRLFERSDTECPTAQLIDALFAQPIQHQYGIS